MSLEPRSAAVGPEDAPPAGSAEEGPPAALTRLLEELARTPQTQLVGTWAHQLGPGEVVGRFELLREAGRGGFGVVFVARDRDLGRLVAFKALRPGRALEPRQAEALRREAEAAAKLNHPSVVTVHDFGTCAAGPYLIMELLQGEPLSARVDRGTLPPTEAVRVATAVAEALVHAHAGGVVHRDLKPGNVFLCEGGAVKVLDFGLARILGTGGLRGGTPGYMAPEQCRGGDEDERTDLFSLGVLLHRMLTGDFPYPVKGGKTEFTERPPRVPEDGGVPASLARLTARLLEPDPARRPASAQEALDALHHVARELDPHVAARRRRWKVAAVVTAALAGLFGLAAGLWMRASDARALVQVTVAVADFANETGDPQLDNLSGLLITSLEQSRKLSVLTRSRMRDELRKLGRDGEGPRIDESMAREVGRVTGAKALLLASMKRLGQQYAVEVRALDPTTDRYLFTVRDGVARKDDVPALIDRLSERTRRELRERGDDIRENRVQMGAAVTRNLEAYQHYFRGMECVERPGNAFEPQTCSPHFQEAVADDPGFALAHFRLAQSLSGVQLNGIVKNDRQVIGRELDLALRDAPRLPAREHGFMLALQARLAGDLDLALARYRDVLARYPDDKHANMLAADLLLARDERAAAIPYLQRAVGLDPFFESAVRQLVHAYGALHRDDELRAQLASWAKLPPNRALSGARIRAAVWLGDLDAALAEAEKVIAAHPDADAATDLANVQFSRGEFRSAEATLANARRATPEDDRLLWYEAHAIAAQGRWSAAARLRTEGMRRSDQEIWKLTSSDALFRLPNLSGERLWELLGATEAYDPEITATMAADFVLASDVARARMLAERLKPLTPDRELADAALAWRGGKVAEAMSRLKALDAVVPLPNWGMPPSFLLAWIASAEGYDADAVQAVQRFKTLWSHLGSRGGWMVPRALLVELRSEARLGHTDRARALATQLVEETARADANDAVANEARSLAASLGISPPARAPLR